MTPIESTYVNAVGYQDEILAIYFTNGSLYYYLAVPELIFNNLLEAAIFNLSAIQIIITLYPPSKDFNANNFKIS